MAMINDFKELPQQQNRRIHSRVDCGYRLIPTDAGVIVQLDTYGSDERQIPGKVSQSIQIDKQGAAKLIDVLKRAFPDLK